MKRSLLYTLIVFLAPAIALAADDPALIVIGGKVFYSPNPGTTATETGIPVEALSNIRYMPGETPPNPDDPDPDDPDPAPSQLRAQVKQWATAVNKPAEAALMAIAYKAIAENIANGKIPATDNDVNRAQREAFEIVFNKTPVDYDDWETFYEEVLDAQADLITANTGGVPKDVWVQHYTDVAGGLNDSNEGNALPEWLKPIIDALIQMLLELILNLFGNAQSALPADQPNVFVLRRSLAWRMPGDNFRAVMAN